MQSEEDWDDSEDWDDDYDDSDSSSVLGMELATKMKLVGSRNSFAQFYLQQSLQILVFTVGREYFSTN